jgi:phosphomannomutase
MIPWLLIAELISSKGQSLSSMLDVCKANYPASGEINRKVKDTSNTILKIRSQYKDHALSIDMMDGVSMEFSDWRFNVRASNTEPLLRLNVESRADYSLMQVKTNELLEIINRDS